MATVVVPYRGSDPKRRLQPMSGADRVALSEAMLADVLVAAREVGAVFVAALPETPLPEGVTLVPDPGEGQGAAVRAALDAAAAAGATGPYLVVNADLPCVSPRDLLALAGAAPADGLALAAAADGTTNALCLTDAALFAPAYGPGSAARYAALAPSVALDLANLADDVDTLADLDRLDGRLGQSTAALLGAWRARRAA